MRLRRGTWGPTLYLAIWQQAVVALKAIGGVLGFEAENSVREGQEGSSCKVKGKGEGSSLQNTRERRRSPWLRGFQR